MWYYQCKAVASYWNCTHVFFSRVPDYDYWWHVANAQDNDVHQPLNSSVLTINLSAQVSV